MAIITYIILSLLQFNTSLFSFKNTYNIPSSDLKEISYFLESERKRIDEKWAINNNNKFTVTFCNSTNEFVWKSGANRKTGSLYKNGNIFLQPTSLLKQKKILYPVLRHELIHALLDNGTKIPKWFNEALAIYESGELKRLKKQKVIKFKTFDDLENCINSKDYKSIETAYYYIGLSMQYIIQHYGEEKIKELLFSCRKNDFETSISTVFKEKFSSIENKTMKYLSGF